MKSAPHVPCGADLFYVMVPYMNNNESCLLMEKYDGVATDLFYEDCKRLKTNEPLAYVIGWQPFLGLKIYLDSCPLIPRPETEWWTEQLIKKHLAKNYACPKNIAPVSTRVLDLCAGSGVIGCAMLNLLPTATVYFGEVDPSHGATILKNIRANNLDESRAHIRIGDLFNPFQEMKFGLIAANPPYIPEKRELEVSVEKYEPPLSLRAGSDGLDVIRRIAAALPHYLATNGMAWIECDSAHAEEACAIFRNQSLSVELFLDQYSKPRVLVVSF